MGYMTPAYNVHHAPYFLLLAASYSQLLLVNFLLVNFLLPHNWIDCLLLTITTDELPPSSQLDRASAGVALPICLQILLLTPPSN